MRRLASPERERTGYRKPLTPGGCATVGLGPVGGTNALAERRTQIPTRKCGTESGLRLLPETGKHISTQVRNIGQVSQDGEGGDFVDPR